MRRLLVLVVLLVAAMAIALGGAPSGGAAGSKTIRVKDNFFSPSRTTISKNTVVTWRWSGDRPHNVRSRGTRRFRGSRTKSSGVHRVRFVRAARYRYVCTIHDGMTGRITVR
jgi:plastocyanin